MSRIRGFHIWLAAVAGLAALQARPAFSVRMPNASMEPTVQAGEVLLVEPADARLPGTLEWGDIVVFEAPTESAEVLVKRVVGLPGDILEIRDKRLYRNGEAVSESYVAHAGREVHRDPESDLWMRDQLAPTSVPEAHVYVLGDNRDRSYDSRSFGPVPAGRVIGKVLREPPANE